LSLVQQAVAAHTVRAGPPHACNRRLNVGLSVSLLLHALLLGLVADGDGTGPPGFSLPWQERRGAEPGAGGDVDGRDLVRRADEGDGVGRSGAEASGRGAAGAAFAG
jgi:hypothetical protein